VTGFLFDENIPRQTTLSASLPIIHATDLGCSVSDSDVWTHAKNHSLVIVSKDADFSNRIMVSSPPPWIVHLRFGNLKRHDYHAFLKRVWPQIEGLLPTHKLINVYLDRVEGIQG
jgi:predicted nuclease of predicted toxin-antitoxin system